MKIHLKFFIKCLAFLTILACLLSVINAVLLPKYTYSTSQWPTTSAYAGFYGIEKDTIDVIFLGSSHAVSSLSPQYLYDSFGYRAYNLGCDQQNLLVSYYWLKEALRFQSPKAVVLDTYICFKYNESEPLNSYEATTRKAIDYMRWSENKVSAVNDICRYDGAQSKMSYYFTNIRFHSRWTDLTAEDFKFMSLGSVSELKGYAALFEESGITSYVPFKGGGSEREPFHPLMLEYLEKIADLCSENHIELILISTPYTEGTAGRYNTASEFAEERGLIYLDFGEAALYSQLSYDFSSDNADYAHAGVSGAEKITGKIGEVLSSLEILTPKSDVQWSSTSAYYKAIKEENR